MGDDGQTPLRAMAGYKIRAEAGDKVLDAPKRIWIHPGSAEYHLTPQYDGDDVEYVRTTVADWQPNEREQMLNALERAQQTRNSLYLALAEAVDTIFSGRLVSIGALKNAYAAQVYVKDVVRWHDVLQLAPKPAPPIQVVEED